MALSPVSPLCQAYFDGSGKHADSAAITLAGIASTESEWEPFDSAWEAVLKTYDLTCFHMCDAIALKGSFIPERGWDETKVAELVSALFSVLYEHRKRGAQFRACTVSCSGYNLAKRDYHTMRPLSAICVDFCVGGLMLPRDHRMMLYFDRSESFMRWIYRVWVRLKKQQQYTWAKQTENIRPVHSGYYAIQASDLIAWSLNREKTAGDYEHYTMLAKMLCFPNGLVEFEYSDLVERYSHDKWSWRGLNATQS